MLQLRFPDDLDAEEFLAEYWQQRPLLMRGALPANIDPVTAEVLAGLACEEEVESRLVLEHGNSPWELRQGPFDEADFAALPDSHWTLLVQDVDKHLESVAQLLKPFDFLPRWRIDDIMASYAADGGSVGPHTDAYDVFLIQTAGQRRWRISSATTTEADLLPDTQLRILDRFEAEQEWLLSPGDMLYLPPGVAHWGVAEGPCITCSVGFRSPSSRELASSWCEQITAQADDDLRYTDPHLDPDQPGGEITPEAVARATDLLAAVLERDSAEQSRWFGSLMTEPKPHLWIEPPARPVSLEDLAGRLDSGERLLRHPYSRLAYARPTERQLVLFADGQAFDAPPALLDAIRQLTLLGPLEEVPHAPWLKVPGGSELLCELFNQGTLIPDDAD